MEVTDPVDPSVIQQILTLVIILVGLIIVVLILKAILMLLIPGVVGFLVYWLTGNLRWAAIAFLAVILIEVLKGKK